MTVELVDNLSGLDDMIGAKLTKGYSSLSPLQNRVAGGHQQLQRMGSPRNTYVSHGSRVENQ